MAGWAGEFPPPAQDGHAAAGGFRPGPGAGAAGAGGGVPEVKVSRRRPLSPGGLALSPGAAISPFPGAVYGSPFPPSQGSGRTGLPAPPPGAGRCRPSPAPRRGQPACAGGAGRPGQATAEEGSAGAGRAAGMAAAGRVLVYGGRGALGSQCVRYFRSRNWVSAGPGGGGGGEAGTPAEGSAASPPGRCRVRRVGERGR